MRIAVDGCAGSWELCREYGITAVVVRRIICAVELPMVAVLALVDEARYLIFFPKYVDWCYSSVLVSSCRYVHVRTRHLIRKRRQAEIYRKTRNSGVSILTLV